jgi:signal transduction protein with GAF and PtsI domain
MNNFYYNPKKGFFGHGVAYEQTVWIKFDEKLSELKGVTFETLYDVILSFKDDFILDRMAMRGTKAIPMKTKIAELGNNLITSQKEFKDNLKYFLCVSQDSILEAYRKAYQLTVESYNPCKIVPKDEADCVKYCHEIVEKYIKKTITSLERYILNTITKDIGYDYILMFDNLKKEHLYNLKKQTKGILVKKFDSNDQVDLGFYKAFNIPIIKYDGDFSLIQECAICTYNNHLIINPNTMERMTFKKEWYEFKDIDLLECIKLNNRIKIYAPIIDDRFIDEIVGSTLYEGVGLYQSEYDFITFGLVLDPDVLYLSYKRVIDKLSKCGKEIMFRLPDIRPEKSKASFGNLTLDIDEYFEYPDIFQACLKAFSKACGSYENVSVVVPMIMSKNEVEEWRTCIEAVFEANKQKIPKIGIMIETEAAFDYLEDYLETKQDFIVIGLDDLVEELHEIDRTENVSLIDFKKDIMRDLREIHRILRQAKVRHICTGNLLSNAEIFDKLIKMGFTEFCIPMEASIQSYKIVEQHFQNKGRYIGEFKKQIEKRDYRKLVLYQTEQNPEEVTP